MSDPSAEPAIAPGEKIGLVGRSGAGKASMRAILFENWTAGETRRVKSLVCVRAAVG